MWLLAVASLVTVGQRVHSVRSSPGAMDKIRAGRRAGKRRAVITTPAGLWTAGRKRLPSGDNLADWGYAAGWRLVRAMPELLRPQRLRRRRPLRGAGRRARNSCARTWPG